MLRQPKSQAVSSQSRIRSGRHVEIMRGGWKRGRLAGSKKCREVCMLLKFVNCVLGSPVGFLRYVWISLTECIASTVVIRRFACFSVRLSLVGLNGLSFSCSVLRSLSSSGKVDEKFHGEIIEEHYSFPACSLVWSLVWRM